MSGDSQLDLAELQRLRQWARVLRGLRAYRFPVSLEAKAVGCLAFAALVLVFLVLVGVNLFVESRALKITLQVTIKTSSAITTGDVLPR